MSVPNRLQRYLSDSILQEIYYFPISSFGAHVYSFLQPTDATTDRAERP